VRLGFLIAAGCGALLLGGAGCGDDTPRPRQPAKPVHLVISFPGDSTVVRGSTTEVRGRVSPARARVKVLGHAVTVRGGEFSSVVPLVEGANVIDVAATARGRSAALTAFRVTREERIAVPDLVGTAADDAAREVERRGLRLEAERGGGLLDPLVPRRLAVCEQSPAANASVRRGATVHVVVARSC
jgi:hypothetical protein